MDGKNSAETLRTKSLWDVIRANNVSLHLRELAGSGRLDLCIRRRIRLWESGIHVGEVNQFEVNERRAATPQQLVSLAAIMAESGLHDIAVQLTHEACALDVNVLEKHRYLGLMQTLFLFQPELKKSFPLDAKAIKKRKKHLGILQSMIIDRSVSVAIVGNSPSILEKQLGNEIDDHDIVIRFNDFNTSSEFSRHTGRKTSIWVHVPYYSDIWRRESESFAHTVSTVRTFWRKLNGHVYWADYLSSGRSIEEIPGKIFFNLARQISAGPSAATAMIGWIDDIRGDLTNVNLYGISLIDQIESGPSRYFHDGGVRAKRTGHNWTGELELIKSLVNRTTQPASPEGSVSPSWSETPPE